MILKRYIAFLAGLVAALSIGAYAVTGGGFPSRPTFQQVHINSSTQEQLTLTGGALGASNVVYAAFRDSAGSRIGYVGDAGSGGSDIFLASDAGTAVVSAGVFNFTLSSLGTVSTNATSVPWCNTGGGSGNCPAKGVQVAGVFSCTSGGCTTTHGTGVSGSPTRNSTGNYTVTFSPTFSSTPSCTAMVNSTTGFAIGLTPGTSSMTFETFNTSGTAIDAPFSILCSN